MSDANDKPIQPQEPVVVDETKFTAEQQLELQRLRAETESHRAEAARAQNSLETINAERRVITEKLTLTRALDASGVRFHSSPADTEAVLRLAYEILSDENGTTAICKATGKVTPLAEAYQQVAIENPTLADGRSLRHLRGEAEADGTPVIRSKADFKTDAEKMKFIREKGVDAFEMLPLRPVTTTEPRTQEAFRALPLSVKTQYIAKHGLEWLQALPKEATADSDNRRAGIRVNKLKK